MQNKCPGCSSTFPSFDGPIHNYMLSTPGCWHAYGLILEREYSDPALFAAAHRMTVDAYALQHPGNPDDRRAVQSVNLHYMSLWLVFEKNYPLKQATKALQILAEHDFGSRPDAPDSYKFTLLNFDKKNHINSAKKWARSAYEAWSDLKPRAQKISEEFKL